MPDGASRPDGRRTDPRDVSRRLERIEEILGLEAEIIRKEMEMDERPQRSLSGFPFRLACMLTRRDLGQELAEGRAARAEVANVALDRLNAAVAAMRRARTSLRNAEAGGADPGMLVSGLEGFWPSHDTDDHPDPERLVTIAAAISSRAAAHAASERARQRIRDEMQLSLEDAVKERETAQLAATRAQRDGAFGELADRRRMLIGVPGLPLAPAGRPKWPAPIPRFFPRDENLARLRHREGADAFSQILQAGYEHNPNAPAAEWPPTEDALRTLALSKAQGRKIARARSADMDPSDRWRYPDLRWEDKDRTHRVSPECMAAFSSDFPGRVPLLASHEGRASLARLPFMPIPRSAASLNMRTHFTTATWDAIAGNLVAMRGERCCICGALSGQMNRSGWFGEIRDRQTGQTVPLANRPIDVHESWEFKVREDGTGVAKLVSLLVVCTDCHATFHVDQILRSAEDYAERTGTDPAVCKEAAVNYVLDRRGTMLDGLTEQPHAAADFLLSAEADLSVRMSGDVMSGKWLMDLSGMRLLNLSGGDPMLRAGANPAMVAGLDIVGTDGTRHAATGIEARAAQLLSSPTPALNSVAQPSWPAQRTASL